MKKQTLIALGVALVALVAVRLLLESHEGEVASGLEEAGIVRLLPADLQTSSVARIEVQGPAPESRDAPKPLVAERAGSGWSVTSAFGAPARADDVNGFLDAVVAAAGELRGEGEKAFATFGVDDAHATTVTLKDASGQVLHVLHLGQRGDDADALFARADDDPAVRHVRADLVRRLGLYGDQRTPATDAWVDKVALKLDGADLTRVEVERPDATWAFERGPASTPPAEGEASGAEADGSAATPPAAGGPGPWTLVSPHVGWNERASSVTSVLDHAGEVRATDILDPAQVPECDVTEGTVSVRLATRDGGEHHLRVGPARSEGDRVIVRVDDSPYCWAMSRWSAQALLPRANVVFDVPPLVTDAPDDQAFDHLAIQRPGEPALELARKGAKEWTLGGAPAATARVDRLVGALRALRPEDVVEASRLAPDLLKPTATITARAGQRQIVVELLGERPGPMPGRLVRVRPGSAVPEGWVAVIPTTSADSLLAGRDELAAPEPAAG